MDDPTEAPVDESGDGGLTLFGGDELFHTTWQEWQGMPEFRQADLQPWASVTVNFRNVDDLREFQRLIDQQIPFPIVRGIWFPKIEITHFMDKRYRDASQSVPDVITTLAQSQAAAPVQSPEGRDQ